MEVKSLLASSRFSSDFCLFWRYGKSVFLLLLFLTSFDIFFPHSELFDMKLRNCSCRHVFLRIFVCLEERDMTV